MSEIILAERASDPGAPAANEVTVFARADGRLYSKDDVGTVVAFAWAPQSVHLVTGAVSSAVTNALAELGAQVTRERADLRFHEQVLLTCLASAVNGANGVRVEYSIDNGTTWSILVSIAALTANVLAASAFVAVPAAAKTDQTLLRVLGGGGGAAVSTFQRATLLCRG